MIVCGFAKIEAENIKSASLKLTIKTSWQPRTNFVHDVNGKSYDVKSMEASFQPGDVPVELTGVLFINPTTKNIWVGLKKDYYVDTDKGIIGVEVVDDRVDWEKSLVSVSDDKEASLDELKIRAVNAIQAYDIPTGSGYRTRIFYSNILSPWYFVTSPRSSAPLQMKPKSMSVEHGVLQLDYENRQNIKASLWIDVQTHKLLKATEEGKQVFPK